MEALQLVPTQPTQTDYPVAEQTSEDRLQGDMIPNQDRRGSLERPQPVMPARVGGQFVLAQVYAA